MLTEAECRDFDEYVRNGGGRDALGFPSGSTHYAFGVGTGINLVGGCNVFYSNGIRVYFNPNGLDAPPALGTGLGNYHVACGICRPPPSPPALPPLDTTGGTPAPSASSGTAMGPCLEANMFDSQWVLADVQQSCAAACTAQGRTCVADAAIPTTDACIDAISKLPSINRPCEVFNLGAGIAIPNIYNIDPERPVVPAAQPGRVHTQLVRAGVVRLRLHVHAHQRHLPAACARARTTRRRRPRRRRR